MANIADTVIRGRPRRPLAPVKPRPIRGKPMPIVPEDRGRPSKPKPRTRVEP